MLLLFIGLTIFTYSLLMSYVLKKVGKPVHVMHQNEHHKYN